MQQDHSGKFYNDSNQESTTERTKKPPAAIIGMRDIAIFKQIWPLDETEKAKLDSNFIFRTTIADLLDNLSTSHAFRDYITMHGKAYEVCYINCGYNQLKDEKPQDTKLLVSMRTNRITNCYLAVVLLNEKMEDKIWDQYRKLDFSL